MGSVADFREQPPEQEGRKEKQPPEQEGRKEKMKAL